MDGHLELVELVPWYANDTLDTSERRRVEEHLRECAECRAQLDLWQRVREGLEESDPIPLQHPARIEHLLSRLDDAIEPEPAPVSRLAAWRRAVPPPLRWTLIAQSAALLVLGALEIGHLRAAPRESGFRTLASVASERPVWTLRLVFDESASEREIRQLLLPLGAEIVSGPSPVGVYTVEVPANEGLEETVGALRSRRSVRFVEPKNREIPSQ